MGTHGMTPTKTLRSVFSWCASQCPKVFRIASRLEDIISICNYCLESDIIQVWALCFTSHDIKNRSKTNTGTHRCGLFSLLYPGLKESHSLVGSKEVLDCAHIWTFIPWAVVFCLAHDNLGVVANRLQTFQIFRSPSVTQLVQEFLLSQSDHF